MRCPKCDHQQPHGSTECVACGIIFAKWRPVRPQGGLGDAPGLPAARETRQAGGSGTPGWLKAVALIAVGAGWYWFFGWAPAGLPASAQAYRDDVQGFAIDAPEGWTARKLADCKDIGGPLSPAGACAVLGVTPGGTQPSPALQVVVAPVSALVRTGWGGTLVVRENDKAALGEALAKGLSATVPGYTRERSAVVTVDGIASLTLVGTATIKGSPVTVGNKVLAVPNMFGRTEEHHLTMGTVLVPAGNNAFVISYVANTSDYEGLAPLFEKAVSSFRVTSGRPTAFQSTGGLLGSIKGDAILGLLVSLTLALLRLR